MQHASPISIGLRTGGCRDCHFGGWCRLCRSSDGAGRCGQPCQQYGWIWAGLPALISNNGADGSTSYSLSLQILALMTAMTVLPSLVLGMTSFTRIIIVLSILRQAMGTQQTPPNQVLIAIALFLTFFIMSPTLTTIYDTAAEPYLNGSVSAESALSSASGDMKKFMVNEYA